jgi:hypothetical protein
VTILNGIILVGSVVGAITTIWAVVSTLLKRFEGNLKEKIVEVVDDRTKELRPNGGGSIKDVVNKLDERVARLEKRGFFFVRR